MLKQTTHNQERAFAGKKQKTKKFRSNRHKNSNARLVEFFQGQR
jgi:hypothetical protein